ncbi:hypothetical protein DFQ26_008520 [Actinomortierella ambigua]|nr:hypothetical protein DFQ26_008520 [Actinomortierella ambigua]
MSSSFSIFRDIEVPLGGNTELNDDAKEKSLRRRSLLDERAARRRSLLSSPNASRTSDAHASGQASPADEENRRRSSGLQRSSTMTGSSSGLAGSIPAGTAAGGSTVLGIVEPNQGPLPALLKVSADSFEQWLKLATDNKINANNSWNFALIDYFHEMSLLRDGDSINFQKASCTLDGCVKIYTSRVDSVATETTKLLGGLATSTKRDDADGGDDENDETDKPRRKRTTHRDNTLAKDFESLSLEKFNLEFAVDPLFKKTSADFDEGGARGLLLNHLSVDPEGKIIFDAGDARDDGDEDNDSDEEEEEEEDQEELEQTSPEKKRSARKKTDVESALLDIQRLRAKFLPALNTIFERDICPSLKDFPLSGTSEMDLSFMRRFNDDGEDYAEPSRSTRRNESVPPEPIDHDDDDNIPDYGDSGFNFPDDDDEHVIDGDQMVEVSVINPEGAGEVVDAFGDLDAQIAARHQAPAPLASAATAAADDDNLMGGAGVLVDDDQLDLYSHFDSALLRNWAGPEHWRLRRIPKMKPTDAPVFDAEGNVIEGGDGKKKGASRAPLVLDFIGSEEVDERELFASADPASMVFTNAMEAEHRRSDHLLPDDVHFSSKQLLRMFLKPSFIVKSANKPKRGYLGSGSMLSAGDLGQGDEENLGSMAYPDEQFWATHSNNVRADDDINQLTEQLDNTQIYNDFIEEDDDEFQFFGGAAGDTAVLEAVVGSAKNKPDSREVQAGVGSSRGAYATTRGLFMGLFDGGDGNDYASQLVSQPTRVKANYIGYSKTAKKVDVKRLKDNIWKEMSSQTLKRTARGDVQDQEDRRKAKLSRMDGDETEGAEKQVAGQDDQGAADEGEDEYVKKEQKFSEIIGGLHKVYPRHKLEEISVPFCFICLLHLANEKNLSISGNDNLNELIIKQEGGTT